MPERVDPPGHSNMVRQPYSSPRKTTPQRPTEFARVQACCGRWNALIRRWDVLTDRGLAIANDIVNAILGRRFSAITAATSLAKIADSQDLFETHYFDTLRRLHPQLANVCTELKTIANQMEAVSVNLATLAGSHNFELCLGATLCEFAESSEALASLYSKEIAVRETIRCSLLTPAHDRRSSLLLLTAWMTEPYVENQSHMKRYVQEVATSIAA
eukprot:m.63835 g.63835  ORF g.63835 m.63835 type:complete len:215 (+) comp9684_c0_seq3:209-853(+)